MPTAAKTFLVHCGFVESDSFAVTDMSVVALEDLSSRLVRREDNGSPDRCHRQKKYAARAPIRHDLIVLVAKGGAVLAPPVLIRLAYDLLVTTNAEEAYLP